MGMSPPERPEQKESKRRGPEAGTNLEETNEGQSGWNTKGECGRTRWLGPDRVESLRTKLGIWSLFLAR